MESSAPDWVPEVKCEDFVIDPCFCLQSAAAAHWLTDWNIFPHPLIADLQAAAPKAKLVPADDVLLKVRCISWNTRSPSFARPTGSPSRP